MDKYRMACDLNEVLISLISVGHERLGIPERIIRRMLRDLGYVPTDGLPIEVDVVESMGGTGKYKRI